MGKTRADIHATRGRIALWLKRKPAATNVLPGKNHVQGVEEPVSKPYFRKMKKRIRAWRAE